MKTQIKRWFTAPIFEGDDEKTWRASLLNTVVNVCVLMVVFLLIGNLVGGRTPATVFAINGFTLVLLYIVHYLIGIGRVSLAGILGITLGFVLVSSGVISLGTIRTPTTAIFLLLVVISGLLFGRMGLLLSMMASSLIVLGLVLAENLGVLPRPDYAVTVTQWVTYTIIFGLTGGLTHLSYQSMQQALKRLFNEMASRRKAEVRLRESEARFRSLVENAPEAVMVMNVETGEFESFNPKAYRLFKLSGEELLEKGPFKMSPPLQPDGRPSAESVLEKIQLATDFQPQQYEWVHRDAEGKDIPCDVYLSRLPSSEKKYCVSALWILRNAGRLKISCVNFPVLWRLLRCR